MSSGFLKRLLLALLGILLVAIAAFVVTLHGSGWDDLAYEQEDSDVKVALDSGKFFQNMDAGDIYGTCVITIAYRYQGNDYISVTAVQVGR